MSEARSREGISACVKSANARLSQRVGPIRERWRGPEYGERASFDITLAEGYESPREKPRFETDPFRIVQ